MGVQSLRNRSVHGQRIDIGNDLVLLFVDVFLVNRVDTVKLSDPVEPFTDDECLVIAGC